MCQQKKGPYLFLLVSAFGDGEYLVVLIYLSQQLKPPGNPPPLTPTPRDGCNFLNSLVACRFRYLYLWNQDYN